jgi:hypothetical protein
MPKPVYNGFLHTGVPDLRDEGCEGIYICYDGDLNRATVPERGNSYPGRGALRYCDFAFARSARAASALGADIPQHGGTVATAIHCTTTYTVSVTAGSSLVTKSAGDSFSYEGDMRKVAVIAGAGPDGAALISTVNGVTSATALNTAMPASTTLASTTLTLLDRFPACYNLEDARLINELDATANRENRQRLIRRLARRFKKARLEQTNHGVTSSQVGIFSWPPQFIADTTGLTSQEIIDYLADAAEDFAPLVQQLDFFAPEAYFESVYVGTGAPQTAWETNQLGVKVTRCRGLHATKPIYPFLSPYIVSGGSAGDLISRAQWQDALAETASVADGCVLWGGVSYEDGSVIAWDDDLLDYVADAISAMEE